jgi:hypothetical protein
MYTIMYECEKSPLTHELSYIWLFNFSPLNLFYVILFIESNSKKFLNPFSFFGTQPWMDQAMLSEYNFILLITTKFGFSQRTTCSNILNKRVVSYAISSLHPPPPPPAHPIQKCDHLLEAIPWLFWNSDYGI